MAWTDGVDHATGYLVLSTDWNSLLGATGSLQGLKAHTHTGAAGDGSSSLGPLTIVKLADGTVGAPSFAFSSELGSGLYRIGAGDVGLSILGVKVAEFTATSAALVQPLTVSGAFIAVGTTPATSGAVRLANAQGISARNFGNTVDMNLIKSDTGNNILIGDSAAGGSQILVFYSAGAEGFWMGGTVARIAGGVAAGGLSVNYGAATAQFGGSVAVGTTLSISTTPATTGAIRTANNQGHYGRNAANTADVRMAFLDNVNQLFIGDANTALTQITGGSSGYTLSVSNVGCLFGGDWGTGQAVSTTQTTGFALIPSSAGPPTGTPTGYSTSRVAMYFDQTNHKLYVYDSTWKSVTLA